jgi:hypothetical protein
MPQLHIPILAQDRNILSRGNVTQSSCGIAYSIKQKNNVLHIVIIVGSHIVIFFTVFILLTDLFNTANILINFDAYT